MRLRDLNELAESEDVETLRNRLVHFAHDIDFGLISSSLIVETQGCPTRTFSFGNTPQTFVPIYESTVVGRRDPVMRRMKRLSVPFTYDQSTYVNEQAADLWDVQAPFGYRTGIAMALHLPKGRHFLIGVDREQPLSDDDQVIARTMADLQLVAVHAMNAAIRHLDSMPPDPLPENRPTARELEVLRWTLAGKTAWEVGMLLSISERTAAIHANRATHKLDCVNKHQAALKAMQLGLI